MGLLAEYDSIKALVRTMNVTIDLLRITGETQAQQAVECAKQALECNMTPERPYYIQPRDITERRKRILDVLKVEPCTVREIITKIGTVPTYSNRYHQFSQTWRGLRCLGHIVREDAELPYVTVYADLKEMVTEGKIVKVPTDNNRVMFFFQD
jgi:hypothetical protein